MYWRVRLKDRFVLNFIIVFVLSNLFLFLTKVGVFQVVEIKKSSYKKVSKFLSEMKSLGYIDIKEEKKGVEQVSII